MKRTDGQQEPCPRPSAPMPRGRTVLATREVGRGPGQALAAAGGTRPRRRSYPGHPAKRRSTRRGRLAEPNTAPWFVTSRPSPTAAKLRRLFGEREDRGGECDSGSARDFFRTRVFITGIALARRGRDFKWPPATTSRAGCDDRCERSFIELGARTPRWRSRRAAGLYKPTRRRQGGAVTVVNRSRPGRAIPPRAGRR